jgi:hypothetical protein
MDRKCLLLVNLFYCFVGCVLGTLVGPPGAGTRLDDCDSSASDDAARPHRIDHYVVWSLLRCDVRRVHHEYSRYIPGEAASVVTCIDGFQMTKQGRAGSCGSLGSVLLSPEPSAALLFPHRPWHREICPEIRPRSTAAPPVQHDHALDPERR